MTVDESLLSGYVLQVGDRVFDNSGRHQLDKMMEGKPSLATLKTRIEDYKPAETSAEGGVVISSADGIVHVEGMNRARSLPSTTVPRVWWRAWTPNSWASCCSTALRPSAWAPW